MPSPFRIAAPPPPEPEPESEPAPVYAPLFPGAEHTVESRCADDDPPQGPHPAWWLTAMGTQIALTGLVASWTYGDPERMAFELWFGVYFALATLLLALAVKGLVAGVEYGGRTRGYRWAVLAVVSVVPALLLETYVWTFAAR